jgi:hypothetical protein
MRTAITKDPVTRSGWYALAGEDNLYAYYTVRGVGALQVTQPRPDYACVTRTRDGSITQIGWPAKGPLAAAAGLVANERGEYPDLTMELARQALEACRNREKILPGMELPAMIYLPANLSGVIVRYRGRTHRRAIEWFRLRKVYMTPISVNGYWLRYDTDPPANIPEVQP